MRMFNPDMIGGLAFSLKGILPLMQLLKIVTSLISISFLNRTFERLIPFRLIEVISPVKSLIPFCSCLS